MILFDTFKDTIFLKETSSLENKSEALKKLMIEYPNNNDLLEEYYIVSKGLLGEKEIKYQLSKANVGMFVLHDINFKFEDLTAQVDYIVITKAYAYFIECKNLVGNITINERGDFIREFTFNNRKIKKGIYSPLRQVEAQRDVYKKIWYDNINGNILRQAFRRYFGNKYFDINNRVLVVTANNDTILNTRYAPKDIKNKIVRSDSLVRKLQEDISYSDKDLWSNKKEIQNWAEAFLSFNVDDDTDYYEYYKNKFIGEDAKDNKEIDEELKDKLINLRKERSNNMKIPAYYVFTNDELNDLVNNKPKSVDELKKILSSVKVKTHGEEIIKVIKEVIKG